MGLLDQDVLVIDQVTSFMSNDFAIHDETGQVVGQIQTEGGLGSRMVMGNRRFTVVDSDGSVLLQIHDTPNIGRDKFELSDASGAAIGRLVKQFTLFGKKLSLQLPGSEMQLAGRLFDFNFEVTADSTTIATISRSWPGLAGGLLGRSRFVVAFAPPATPEMRRGIIGAVVAVDLIRAKEERAAASSSSS